MLSYVNFKGGWLALLTGQTESVTGEPMALVVEHSECEFDQLMALAAERAREAGALWLSSYARPEDERLRELGFEPDFHRVEKRVTSAPLPADFPFRVRRGDPSDLAFVLWLSSQVAECSIPPGRGDVRERVQERYLDTYMALDFDEVCVLIAEDLEGEPCGYLMLKTGYFDTRTAEPILYCYDLAVAPPRWGQKTARALLHAAETMLASQGGGLLMGDVSGANLRALEAGLRRGGFAVRERRWSLSLERSHSHV